MSTNLTRTFTIKLKRIKHSEVDDRIRAVVLSEGEPMLEYQDQYEGKWYQRFMAPVRVKYGDDITPYDKLPFTNGVLKPFAKLILTISGITIFQIIWWIIWLSILL